jgi:hypothetical protein
LLRADEVLAPDFQTVDAELFGSFVSQAFDVQH